MIKKIIRTPKIFIISHRLDVTLWKYFTNSVCAASMFKYDESTLESILQRTATRACNKKVQNNYQFSLTHTHTRLTALFPGLPRWAGTRKVKPIWILRKQETVSGSGISWAICKCILLQTDNHASTPPLCFYRPHALPAAQPTASKHWRQRHLLLHIFIHSNYFNVKF